MKRWKIAKFKNKIKHIMTEDEKKEYQKRYYQKNKEKLLAKAKNRYEKNVDKMREYQRNYFNNHKEEYQEARTKRLNNMTEEEKNLYRLRLRNYSLKYSIKQKIKNNKSLNNKELNYLIENNLSNATISIVF
jgi:hypothetical protein